MATCPKLDDEGSQCASGNPLQSKTHRQDLALGQMCTIAPSVVQLEIVLTWSQFDSAVDADLDLLAFLFDAEGNALEVIGFCNPLSTTTGIELTSGDQRAGLIGETMTIQMHRIAESTSCIALVAMCPSTTICMTTVTNMVLTIESSSNTGKERSVVRYHVPPLGDSASSSADFRHMLLVGSLLRQRGGGGRWSLSTHRSLLRGTTLADAVLPIATTLSLPRDGHIFFSFPLHLEKDECVLLNNGSGDGSASNNASMTSALSSSSSSARSVASVGRPQQQTIELGAGWDVSPGGGEGQHSDIDVSCLAFDRSRGVLEDFLYWGKLKACNDSLVHSGDNETGEGDGLDETITVHLHLVPRNVDCLVFAVSNYSPGSLSVLRNIFFVVKRMSDEAELARFDSVGCGGEYSSFFPCLLERTSVGSNRWALRVLSLPSPGKSVADGDLRQAAMTLAMKNLCGAATTAPRAINLRRAMQQQTQKKRQADGGGTTTTIHKAACGGAVPLALKQGAVPPVADPTVPAVVNRPNHNNNNNNKTLINLILVIAMFVCWRVFKALFGR